MMESLSIDTPRLHLRRLAPDDREEFLRVAELSSAHFAKFSPPRTDGDPAADQFQAELSRANEGVRSGNALRLVAVARRGDHEFSDLAGRHVGYFNLNNIVRGAFQNADAGWRTSAEALNRGVATEGVKALLDLAFSPPPRGLGLHRVQANIQPNNAPSLVVAKRCGFREEGFAPRMLHIAGDWRDHIMFAKLADEHGVPPPLV